MDVHSGSASGTLDRIREGGTNLVLTARQRIGELNRALDNGRFNEAFTVGQSLIEKLGHLAAAQAALGRLADASIVRAGDLEPGMWIPDAGQVSEVGPCSNCERQECDNITITFESGHRVTMDCDDEVAVTSSED